MGIDFITETKYVYDYVPYRIGGLRGDAQSLDDAFVQAEFNKGVMERLYPSSSFEIRIIPDNVPLCFRAECARHALRRLASMSGFVTVQEFKRDCESTPRGGLAIVELSRDGYK